MEPIVIDQVTKRYGSIRALEDVSFDIEPGTVHGLLGPNGSGKTTIIRLIAGLESPTQGSIRRPSTTLGVSFQQPTFFPSLTVDENISTFGELAGRQPDPQWVEELCERIRLTPVRHRLARDLSGGFSKKLDLVLALLKQPQILLLDEPISDIDDRSRIDIRDFIGSYRREDRIILLSTHDVEGFAPIIDQVTAMLDGRSRFEGTLSAYNEWLESDRSNER